MLGVSEGLRVGKSPRAELSVNRATPPLLCFPSAPNRAWSTKPSSGHSSTSGMGLDQPVPAIVGL